MRENLISLYSPAVLKVNKIFLYFLRVQHSDIIVISYSVTIIIIIILPQQHNTKCVTLGIKSCKSIRLRTMLVQLLVYSQLITRESVLVIPYILESNPRPNLIRTSFCRFLKRKKVISRF